MLPVFSVATYLYKAHCHQNILLRKHCQKDSEQAGNPSAKKGFGILSMGFSYSAADWLQALHDLHIVCLLPICLPCGQPEDWLQRTFPNISAGVLMSSRLYSTCGPVLWMWLQACSRLLHRDMNLLEKGSPRILISGSIGKLTI